MHNRRIFLTSVASTAALLPVMHGARAATATPISKAAPDTPKATVIAGNPPILDFGDGVRVPCAKDAFLTLWEGKTYWLTLGAGRSHYAMQAQGQAVNYALAAMKLLLLTQAFAPDRLQAVEGCGWRLKSGRVADFVHGDVHLPGAPFWPGTDAFMDFGHSDDPALASLSLGNTSPGASSVNFDVTGSNAYVDAFSAYVVFKRDTTLEWIRAHAEVLPLG